MRIGMVDMIGDTSTSTRMVLILEEYDTECLVLWGRDIKKSGPLEMYTNDKLICKKRIYNIKVKEISKFRLWCYKYWDNNF